MFPFAREIWFNHIIRIYHGSFMDLIEMIENLPNAKIVNIGECRKLELNVLRVKSGIYKKKFFLFLYWPMMTEHIPLDLIDFSIEPFMKSINQFNWNERIKRTKVKKPWIHAQWGRYFGVAYVFYLHSGTVYLTYKEMNIDKSIGRIHWSIPHFNSFYMSRFMQRFN